MSDKDQPLPESSKTAAPHDPAVPDAFAQFMASSWAEPSDTLPDRAEVASYTARRRRAVCNAFPGDYVVVPTGTLKVRANDTDYVFRPGSDFFWLTGCHESDAVVIMSCADAGDPHSTLYLPGRSDRTTSAFYRDRRYGELWVGPRRGVAETQAALDIECRPIEELQGALDKLDPRKVRVLRGLDAGVDAAVPVAGETRDTDLARVLSELRLIKDEYEIGKLRDAVAATKVGFEEAIREFDTAAGLERGERWIEGTFWRRARTNGNDVGYTSIVACGHHATTLHWVTNDGPIQPGDLALMDMGVEGDELYTADVTRTLPVNGRFSETQLRLYEVVHKAQAAAIKAVKPGVAFTEPHKTAMRIIAEALEEWGILPVSAEEALKPESNVYRRYTLHGVSHMLGLDVHDCANASSDAYYNGTLAPGMVLTIEPGLYFQRDDETVPEELRGIGIRIEDDVLVTDDGCDVLSDSMPTEAGEVEAWIAAVRAR